MTAQQKIEAPPTTVNAAIAQVMAGIKRIEKDEKNSHGNYKFAGIDAFLDLTRPLCAAAGLVIYQDEESCEVVDTTNGKAALLMKFVFTLECGDDQRGPFRRTIMVPAAMGSQAFGAAQSYALKQFERALFQISTGEKDDIDHHDTGELSAPEPKAKRENWGGRYPTKTALKQAMHVHNAELQRIGTEGTFDDLDAYLTSPEYQDYIRQAGEHAECYLTGGEPAPPEYVGTFDLEQKARDMIALRGNVPADKEPAE